MWNLFKKREIKNIQKESQNESSRTLEDIMGKDYTNKRRYPRRLEDFKKIKSKPASEKINSKDFSDTVKRITQEEPENLRFIPKSNETSINKTSVQPVRTNHPKPIDKTDQPKPKSESQIDSIPKPATISPKAESSIHHSIHESNTKKTKISSASTPTETPSKIAEKPKDSRPIKSSVFKEIMPEIHESVDGNIHLIALIGRYDGKTYFEEGDSSYDLQALTTLTSALENEMETVGLKNIRHGLIHLDDNKMMMVLFFDEHFMVFLFDENPVIPGQMLFIVRPRILELYPQALI